MPANLNDDVIFTADAQGRPLHHLPPRHRQEGLREGAPALHHAPEPGDCTCRARTRSSASAARSATRAAAAPPASQNAAHTAVLRGAGEGLGQVHRPATTYHGLHYWDLPMMAKGHTEAQCAKCHQGVVEVPQGRAASTPARFLVERYGCYGCHKIKGWEGLRKVGPDLTQDHGQDQRGVDATAGSRSPRASAPRACRRCGTCASTRPPSRSAQRRRDQRGGRLPAGQRDGARRYAAPPAGDLAAGRKTFETVGCLGCHRVGDDKRGMDTLHGRVLPHPRPQPRRHRQQGQRRLALRLGAGPQGLLARHADAEPAAHRQGGGGHHRLPDEPQERRLPRAGRGRRSTPAVRDAIVARAPAGRQRARQAGRPADREAWTTSSARCSSARRRSRRYGCFGCHEIKGFEKATPIGVELTEQGSKLVERLDFGYEHGQIPHTLPGWVNRKVMEPRVFDRGQGEAAGRAAAHAEVLRGRRGGGRHRHRRSCRSPRSRCPLAAQKQLSARTSATCETGLRLVRDFNCRGCHQVGDVAAATIRKVVEEPARGVGRRRAAGPGALAAACSTTPSRKIGEGARVHTDWLHGFLDDPATRSGPGSTCACPPSSSPRSSSTRSRRYFAAQDRVPYPYAPQPAQRSGDGGARPRPVQRAGSA